MMKFKKKGIMAAVLALVLVVSVFATRPFFKTGTGDGTTDAPDTFVVPSAEELGYKPVVISADIFKQNWQAGDGARVNTEGNATVFQVGDQIFIENLNQAMANHANRSAVYTFDGIRWKPEDGKWLAWDESNGSTTRNEFLAYTPVTTGTTKFDFFLPADQSTIEKLRSADYMIAAAIETPETDKQVELKFSHMLAKITVTIFGDEGTIDNVRIISPLSGVGEGATDLNAEITPYAQYDSENGCYRYIAVIAPGTYNDDELLRYAKDGVTISVQIPSTLTDKKINYGKHYQLTIHEDMAIGTVTVMDWNEVTPIDAPTATEPEASYSISGTTANLTVPEYASAASVQAAAQAALAEKSDITYLVVNGALTEAQQNALAEGLAGAAYLQTVTLTNVPLASITPAVAALYSTVACDDFEKVVSSDGYSIVQGGSVGDNATYTLYYGNSAASMTLNIDGTGAMNDFEYYVPWSDYNIYITTVNIANGITSIGKIAFYNCVITSVTIPGSVTNINDLAFADCSQLMTVVCKSANPPTLGLDILKNIEGFTIYVPAESVDTYKYKWSAYADKIQPIQ